MNNNNFEISLKPNDKLEAKGIVQKFVLNKIHKYIKIELNHKYEKTTVTVPTIDVKNWTKFQDLVKKELNRKKVYDQEDLESILDTLDENFDTIAYNCNIDDTEGDNKDQEKEKTKLREIPIYKYSQMGKSPLHESALVNDLPFFIKYDHNLNTYELVEKIEENSRILRPPQSEEYAYTPYEFESNEELAFFMQKARQVTKDQLFKFSKDLFSRYVDQDKYIIIILAADAIWTYFQDLFPATHYGEGVGTNDIGKSSLGYTFEYTGYRVVKATEISGANYSRIFGSIEPGQCVIIEDEGDSISEDPDKVRLLKAGYEYNSKIPKINMNTVNQEQKWYCTYGYKLILAEKSLKEYKARGLVDRTFSFPLRPGKVKYAIKEVVSRNLNKSPRLQKLYNELLSFRKLMLCYRLIHYKDLLPEIETGLVNRDQELCKPLLQLFYETETLKEIIPALEDFVKQRRTRKATSLEATLYPIIKKFVFAEANLDSLQNTYSELKAKKTSIKVGFWRIWEYIKEGRINGHYDEKKKYQYETLEHGILYLNSLPTIIREKFTASRKIEDYGVALIFDIEKLEKFDNLYSKNHLKGDNIKIEVKLKIEDETGDSGDSGDFCDFLGMRLNNISSENQLQYNKNNNLGSNDPKDKSNSNSNNNTYAFQKSQESQESPESPESPGINNDSKEVKPTE